MHLWGMNLLPIILFLLVRLLGVKNLRKFFTLLHRNMSIVSQRAILPHKDHYLDLDPTYKDDYGDPLIRVTFDYTEMDRKRNEFLVDKM